MEGGKRMSKTTRYVECAHCGETVGTHYVTCPYCGYRLPTRKTSMDPLYGMTDSEFYRRFGSMRWKTKDQERDFPKHTTDNPHKETTE